MNVIFLIMALNGPINDVLKGLTNQHSGLKDLIKMAAGDWESIMAFSTTPWFPKYRHKALLIRE